MKCRTFFLTFILLSAVGPAYSDNITGPVRNIYKIDTSAGTAGEIDASPEDIIALQLENNDNLPLKVQLEIRPSERLKDFPHTFALYVYNNISPSPSAETGSYSGDIVKYLVIPDKTRHFIELYFQSRPQRSEIIPGTDIVVPDDFKKKPFPLLLTVLPVMKGIPDNLLTEKYRIKLTVFNPDRGELSVKVSEKNNSSTDSSTEVTNYTLYIDGKVLQKTDKTVLAPGIRKIRVEKEGFIPFEQSVVINKNETTTVNALLSRKAPQVFIIAPSEAEVFIDSVRVTEKELNSLREGEHTVIFKLGQYSISRKFTLENGKKYSLNLLLDIDIREE